jgi:hypothetical protein
MSPAATPTRAWCGILGENRRLPKLAPQTGIPKRAPWLKERAAMAARKERRYAAVSVLRCAFQVRLRGPCEGLHFGICRTSWIQPCALRLVAFANRDSALQSCRLTAFVHSLLLTFGLSLTISPALSEKSQQPPVCRVNEAPATPKVVFQKRNRRRGDHDQRLTYRMPTSDGYSSTAASGSKAPF